jgi:serine/threonine protein kinase
LHTQVVDFGFAKFLEASVKTYTLCGTPEYLGEMMRIVSEMMRIVSEMMRIVPRRTPHTHLLTIRIISAPELVLGNGHNRGVDYWALGVLIYEMVTGYSLFAGEEAPEQMAIFRNIIRVKVVGEWTCSPSCKHLIQSLCTKEVHQRLGCLKVLCY